MSETHAPADPRLPSIADPHLTGAAEVAAAMGVDPEQGLTGEEAQARLAEYGPNTISAEPPPSVWSVVLGQLRDPMQLMLLAVAVVSFLIAQTSTGVLVALLVVLNVVLGTRQELAARASVDALATMQVPQTRVRRDGGLLQLAAVDVVPGDVVMVEAGDLVPADGRLVRSATLEVQEAALTGESAPVAKDPGTLAGEVTLGDRTNMLFQNTSVTRGTATMVVTGTGMSTQMGQIATMLSSVSRTRSPLQRELDSLTRLLGTIAWGAVAVIVVMGLLRGMNGADVLLLGVAMAISAIPTGLPTFVTGMLSFGARELADAKAVVKNLTDVETLGATSAINTDKTGTLTLNEMMVSTLYAADHWYTVDGEGYKMTGTIRSVAGVGVPDFTQLALGLVLASDATVGHDLSVVGDPTEAALVVLAGKLGVDAEETRRAYPRLAEVPFDSDYKFMATFHEVEVDGVERTIELVKGAPDVVLGRCGSTGLVREPTRMRAEARTAVEAANARMGEKGLRVLAFAARLLDDADVATMATDPMALTQDLTFVAMVGIIDPLRPEAKAAVRTALGAGIDVRMITGDHAVTARAIGEELGLGPGAISGAELQAMSDARLEQRLPDLHVFGRVTPEDKLRLAQVMQHSGLVVAMTGDAVNDAAALKQADIGVAMGSGSEVSKQAARMILTDDNFGTLVHAVELGRSIYDKIVSYIRYQMSQLLSLVLIFLTASIFEINSGVAMTPIQVLFLNFFVSIFPVIAIITAKVDPGIMDRPPRDPSVPLANGRAVRQWVLYGATLFLAGLVPLVFGPDDPSPKVASASMTMTFVVFGLGTVLSGLVMRRDPGSGLTPPILPALKILAIPALLVVLSTELGFLQRWLTTQSLSGGQWLASLGLALAVGLVVEVDKCVRRRRTPGRPGADVEHAVAPSRAASH
ncbi:MAG: cation-translocating P-type ATPase [Actinomycetales bacterium]|nr:cation-translocating P-type ATPase [Actinomycetales bacterium]